MNTETKEKFELGERQLKWIEALKENPHLQMSSILGVVDCDGNIKGACCLGMAEKIICDTKNNELNINSHYQIISDTSNNYLVNFNEIGLNSKDGECNRKYFKVVYEYLKTQYGININQVRLSLSALNDKCLNWTQIAQLLIDHPEAYFVKSI